MPVYEYVCRRCTHPFEELVLGSERPACPECGASDPEKRFSAFASPSGNGAPDAADPSCGTCGDPRGPGACAFD